jgi:hypothetical protein
MKIGEALDKVRYKADLAISDKCTLEEASEKMRARLDLAL